MLCRVFRIFAVILTLIACMDLSFALDKNAQERLEAMFRTFVADNPVDSGQTIGRLDEIQETKTLPPDSALYSAMNHYGRQLMLQGRQATSMNFYEQAIDIINNSASHTPLDIEASLQGYLIIGSSLEELGMGTIALDVYRNGLKIARDNNATVYTGMFLNNIGIVYFDVDMYAEAIGYLKKALEANMAVYNPAEIVLNYSNLAEIYEAVDSTGLALDCNLKALQYVSEKDTPHQFYLLHLNLGKLYEELGDHQIAVSYLKNAVRHFENLRSVPDAIKGYMALAEFYRNTNQTDSALYYSQLAIDNARRSDLKPLEVLSMSNIASVYQKTGQDAQALQWLQKAVALKDSLQQAQNQRRITEPVNNLTLTRLSSAKRQWHSNVWLWIAIALLFVVIALTVWILKLKKPRLGEREHAKLRDEIEQSHRQLTTYALSQLQTAEAIDSLQDELKQVLLELNPRDKEHKTHIKDLVNRLSQLKAQDSWDEFKYYFESVHPDFYKRLEEKHPGLTRRDMHICAFIYLDLSTKQIASITYREVRSVESARNRLRKKLELPPETDLGYYLRSV